MSIPKIPATAPSHHLRIDTAENIHEKRRANDLLEVKKAIQAITIPGTALRMKSSHFILKCVRIAVLRILSYHPITKRRAKKLRFLPSIQLCGNSGLFT